MVRGAPAIKKAISDFANIKDGETSADGLFTLQEVECLGACVNAPMIQVNNREFYEHLTPEIMVNMMETWKKGGTVPEGNQNGLKTCEGPMGKTGLLDADIPVRAWRLLQRCRHSTKRRARGRIPLPHPPPSTPKKGGLPRP